MKNHLAGFFFLFVIFDACSQTIKPYDLIPYRKDTLWGFADTTKKIIIPPQFHEVKFFDDLTAAVRKGNMWAFIDKKGKELTEYKYDAVGTFSDGMAQVRANNKVGYVNNKGKEEVVPQFTFCEEFSEGVGVVRDSVNGQLLSGVVNKAGRYVLSKELNIITSQFHSGYIVIKEQDKYFFIDKAGKKLKIPANAELFQEFSDGVAFVKVAKYNKSTDNKRVEHIDTVYYLGIINTLGQYVTDSVNNGNGQRLELNDNYVLATNYSNGFAVVQHKFMDNNWYTGAFENNEYAFLDKTGKISAWYSSVRAFGIDQLAIVTKKGEYSACIIDGQYNIIKSSVTVYDAGLFSEGLLRVKKSQYGKWSFIDKKGNSPFNFEYDTASDFYRGIAVVKLVGRNGCINRKGDRFWE